MIHSAIFAIALLSAVSSEIPNFDQVLLPMHNGDAHGASGSVWKVDEVISNASDEDVTFYPYFFQASWFQPMVGSLAPGKTLHVQEIDQPTGGRGGPRPVPHPGALFYVQSDHVDRLVMYDRVYEANVDRDNHGTVIPAVHERSFRKGRTTFPAIPLNGDFRSTLRVYNLTLTQQEVSIRVVRATTGGDVMLAAVTLTVPAASGVPVYEPPYAVPLRPGYQQVAIESLLSLPSDGTVRVIVDGASDAEYWAFVSVTSNRASRVTVFVP
jgi:hypothetical protein